VFECNLYSLNDLLGQFEYHFEIFHRGLPPLQMMMTILTMILPIDHMMFFLSV
jgi:hypothetical protein